MVVFGATTEDTVDLNLRQFFYKQVKLLGSTMGSKEELQALLIFMEKHEIHPIVGHTYNLEDVEEDRKSTRLNSSHVATSYAVFCLKKKEINCCVRTG